MVNFGQHMLQSQHGPWAVHYMDYNHLKQLLEEEESSGISRGSSLSVSSSRQPNSAVEFLSQLYLQTEKVTFFVLQEQGRIARELSDHRQLMLQGVNVAVSQEEVTELVQLEEQYLETGISLLRLIRFVDLNVTGFRKILKKHDKMAQFKLSRFYLALRRHEVDVPRSLTTHPRDEALHLVALGNQVLQPLLNDQFLSATIVAYEAGIDNLRFYWRQYEQLHAPTVETLNNPMEKHSRNRTAPNLLELDLNPTSVGETSTIPSHNNNRSHGDLFRMMDYNALTTTSSPTSRGGGGGGTGHLLLQIHAARSRLRHTNDFVKHLGASLMVHVPHEEEGSVDAKEMVQELHRPNQFSNFLNLFSTFLYMTNYFIAAPTSASYAARVGSDSSIASIIIGMTSVAALVSTLLYSWWTSYSYKSALVFASACCVIGNLLYASGLPCHSLSIVMLGRLLTGFGSARSINRRYIADSYSQSERTTASAAFVTASALGMATGPALASILHLATESSTNVYWQAENAPGWFMFAVWLVFLVCLIWKFEDPPRSTSKQVDVVVDESKQGNSQEKMHLLAGADISSAKEKNNQRLNIPVIITLIVYMVLKMVLEAVTSSEENLTSLYFGWEGSIMGVHLAILALLIIPINFCVSFLARSYFDRELIIGLLVAMLIGCVIILQYGDIANYNLAQYLVGSAMIFCCANALEAPNMSLLSKVIPRKWNDFINVGLLATESGTLGRVIGDVLLAAVGSHGLESLLNRAFGAFAVIILGTLITNFVFFDHMVEPTEKDE